MHLTTDDKFRARRGCPDGMPANRRYARRREVTMVTGTATPSLLKA